MNREDFVAAVKLRTSDAAVRALASILVKPPGRAPSDEYTALSKWYGRLSEKDRGFVLAAAREAAEQAVFGFFAILDGVRAIEDGKEKGELQLYFVRAKERVRLNPETGEELHNLYNALVQEQQA